MPSYSTNDLRSGLKVMIDGEPCNIVDVEFVKPGKGQAFARVKYRVLTTDRVNEITLKSGDSLEGADVHQTEMQYLYNDGTSWVFMNPETYEQHEVRGESLEGTKEWVKEQDMCLVTLYNGVPLLVEPPNHVTLEVTQTDPGVRGDTSSGGNKPATLETGAVVKVPLFIDIGDLIKVDTRSGEYISRAKE